MSDWDEVALGVLIHLGDVLAEGGTVSEALAVSVPGLPERDLRMLDRYAAALSSEVVRLRAVWVTLDEDGKAAHMARILAGWKQAHGR